MSNEIVNGVLNCHKMGIIHHDLKPENILVKVNSKSVVKKVKLADFGMSRKTSEVLTAGPDSRGTIAYAAPEIFNRGKKFD